MEDWGDVDENQIKDGGNTIIKCSNCDKKLVDVWITRPNYPQVWNIVAKCCYCPDQSFPVKINGLFVLGGISKNFDEQTTNDVGLTALDRIDYDEENKTITIETVKA